MTRNRGTPDTLRRASNQQRTGKIPVQILVAAIVLIAFVGVLAVTGCEDIAGTGTTTEQASVTSATVPAGTQAPAGTEATTGPTSAGTTGPTAPPAAEPTWSGFSALPGGGTTDVSPAATVFNNQLYLFSKGIGDKKIYVNVCTP